MLDSHRNTMQIMCSWFMSQLGLLLSHVVEVEPVGTAADNAQALFDPYDQVALQQASTFEEYDEVRTDPLPQTVFAIRLSAGTEFCMGGRR